ncbi:MAG: hypothetical protein ACYDAR_05710 [Thermomicrobiales bacterium]
MVEQERERPTRRAIIIPHFWGWFAFAIIAVIVVMLTIVHPFIVPKSVVYSIAAICGLWWLVGGLIFRVRFARVIRGGKRRRSGLRVGGWALDGWQARHQRHGSYWRAMRSWIR